MNISMNTVLEASLDGQDSRLHSLPARYALTFGSSASRKMNMTFRQAYVRATLVARRIPLYSHSDAIASQREGTFSSDGPRLMI